MARGRVELGEITLGPSDETDLEREQRLAENPVWSRRIQQAEQNLQEQGVAGGPDVTWTRRDQAPEPDRFDENEFLRGLSTIGRQVAQGATFDFADELAGGAVAALPESARGYLAEQFAPDDATPNEREAYRQAGRDLTYRDVQQAGQAQSERDREERPGVSLASNVAGGLMAGRIAGPAAGSGTRAVGGAVERVAPALARPLRTAASAVRGNAAGRVATNIVGSTAMGAGYGALAGAGASRGNLDTEEGRERMQEDIGSGTTTGAVLGGGLGVLSEGLNAAVPYVRRNISGLQGADIPQDMAEELMAVPQNPSIPERLQRTASPQTVRRELDRRGQQAQQALFSAEEGATVSSLIMDNVEELATRSLERLPTGIQPRLQRVLRNLRTEARTSMRRVNGMPAASMNAILDELESLAQQGSRDAARIHSELTGLTRKGIQTSALEASDYLNVMDNVRQQAQQAGTPVFSSPHLRKAMQEAQTQLQSSMGIQEQQQVLKRVDEALRVLKENVERLGGRANLFSLENMIGRYANYSLSGIPLSPRDLQRALPVVAGLLRVGMQGFMNPSMGGLTSRSVNQEDLQMEPMEPIETEQSGLTPEEEEELRMLEQMEAEETQNRGLTPEEEEELRMLEELEAQDNARGQRRSLRSQRRRERNRR